MESRNPVFARTEGFQRGGYATFDTRTSAPSDPRTPSAGELQDMYAAPPATPLQTGRMTIDDVVARTAMVFGVLLVTAVPTFMLIEPGQFAIVIGAMLLGLVLGLVNSFKSKPSPALILAYAAVEGVFVGGLSAVYETYWDGIVAQAVLGTIAAFASMLALYTFRVVRATPKFRRILMIAGFGYLIFSLAHFVGVWVGAWDSIYRSGGLFPIVLSAAGVVLASLFLVLDFDFIEQGIRNGIPQQYAWTAAFGLVVTLVWLYLEILRLISILRGD